MQKKKITVGRERNIDFLSSGERKGKSLNRGTCPAEAVIKPFARSSSDKVLIL